MSSCKACNHQQRDLIDQQLIAGVSYRAIGQHFGLSLGALNRHRRHVIDMVKELPPEERMERGSKLLQRVESLLDDTKEILTAVKNAKDFNTATKAIGAATRLLELVGRLSGELQTPGSGIHLHQTRNVTNIVNIRNDDIEVALLIAEATRNYDPNEIQRLRMLAQSAVTQP